MWSQSKSRKLYHSQVRGTVGKKFLLIKISLTEVTTYLCPRISCSWTCSSPVHDVYEKASLQYSPIFPTRYSSLSNSTRSLFVLFRLSMTSVVSIFQQAQGYRR